MTNPNEPAKADLREQVAKALAPFMYPELGEVAATCLAERPSNYAPETYLGAAVDAILALFPTDAQATIDRLTEERDRLREGDRFD